MGTINYTGQEGDQYHRLRHGEIFGNEDLITAWGRYAQATYLSEVTSAHKVLEIGAGTGINLSSVNKLADVVAVEPAEEAREHCRKLGIKAVSSLDDLPTDVRFDYILMRHVLEHTNEPRQFLVTVRNMLAQGGKLVLVLPVESPYKKIDPGDIDHHLYCWNRQTIGNLLTSLGYRVTEARINRYNGRRIFLPVFKFFGVGVYGKLLSILGTIIPHSEIIVVAEEKGEGGP
ncbi:MAG: class I SAM-dependent methyltransferase [Proteobacteria bacterium]|nr:class I SAM-dependent methyltransferase [Pseudomonadota bacterium]MBU1738859.1 class I SAM-dependent methyltransferase [Pseudomonadota bacterium]